MAAATAPTDCAPCGGPGTPCIGNDTDKVFTSDGLTTNIDGNQLPNSPENTVSVSFAYTFNFSFGTITPTLGLFVDGRCVRA